MSITIIILPKWEAGTVTPGPHMSGIGHFTTLRSTPPKCESCFDPLEVYKEKKQLCSEGQELAVDVARPIFHRKDSKVNSREKEDFEGVVITLFELPHDYVQSSSLLEAIQRAAKNGEKFIKSESHGRTHYVSHQGSSLPESRTPEPANRHEVRIAEPSLESVGSVGSVNGDDLEVFSPVDSAKGDKLEDVSELKCRPLYGNDMIDLEDVRKWWEVRCNV